MLANINILTDKCINLYNLTHVPQPINSDLLKIKQCIQEIKDITFDV